MGGLAVLLLGLGLSLGFVYLAMGILIGSAVIPIALTILWKRTNRVAATAGAIIGLLVAVTTWVSVAASLPEYGGEVTLASLGHNFSMLFGNVAGILTGGAVAIFGSLASKTTFDWKDLREKITLVELSAAASAQVTENEETLKRAFKFSLKGGGLMTLVLIIAWPMPLIASSYVFDQLSYGAWVAISVVWVSVAAGFIIFLPIIEARHGIAQVIRGNGKSSSDSASTTAETTGTDKK
jgi:Na+/proline symporter